MRKMILKAKAMMPLVKLERMREYVIDQAKNFDVIVIPDDFELEFEPSEEWIPTRIILPDMFKDILFCDKSGIIYSGCMDYLKRFVDRSGEQIVEDIVAWMPAPKPYREK